MKCTLCGRLLDGYYWGRWRGEKNVCFPCVYELTKDEEYDYER